jgi:hypothetical protein
MRRNRKKRKSQNNSFRLFAWVLALAVALGSWPFAGTRLCFFLEVTAALLFALGAVWPHMFRGLYSPLSRLARRAWFS